MAYFQKLNVVVLSLLFSSPIWGAGMTSEQLQKEIDKAYENGGGTVTVPIGQNDMTTMIDLKPGVKLVGESRTGSILYAHHSITWTGPLIRVQGRKPGSHPFGSLYDSLDCPGIENITLWGRNGADTDPMHSVILIEDPGYPATRDRGTTGMRIMGVNVLYGYDGLRVIGDTTFLSVRDTQFINQMGNGMNLWDGVNAMMTVDSSYIRGSGINGFFARNYTGRIVGVASEGIAGYPFFIQDSHEVVIDTPYVEQTPAVPGKAALVLMEVKGVTINQPSFLGYGNPTPAPTDGAGIEIYRSSSVQINGGSINGYKNFGIFYSPIGHPNTWVEDWEVGGVVVSGTVIKGVKVTNAPGAIKTEGVISNVRQDSKKRLKKELLDEGNE